MPASSNLNAATQQQLPTGTLVRRLLGLAWGYRAQMITVLALQLVLLVLTLGGLNLLGLGIDVIGHAFAPDRLKPPTWPLGLRPPAEWTPAWRVGAVAALILIVGTLRFVLERSFNLRIALLVQDIVVELRTRVYDKLQRLSFRFFDANESASLINRVTGDVQMVRMFVDQVMVQVMILVISLTFFAGFMLSLHVTLTLACLATTPLLWLLTASFSRIVKPGYRENRRLVDQAIRVLNENAQGVHVIRGFSRESQEIERFGESNRAAAAQARGLATTVAVFVPLIGFLPQLNLCVLLVYGAWIYATDPAFTLGTLIVFSGLLQQFSSQVGNIAQIANGVQASLTGAQRVFEVLDAPIEIQSAPDAEPLGRAAGAVTFESVTFRYRPDAEPVLHDISFSAEPGQTVAILGATGSGKSTLLSLIPRFYDPDNGSVRIDGRDLRRLPLDDLRRNVGLVFQESFLFSNTVADNIAFGHPDATRAQIEAAAKVAAAHDFITHDLADGYDTVLTEGGNNLSGGQRQRLAIARAVLLDPPILLMDDPTAAIDPETEHEILDAMSRAMRDRTTFVVAHRMSTLRRASLVLVLERGRIIEAGPPEDLMRRGGHFRGAADLQSADDESRRLLGMLLPDTGAPGGGA